MKCFRLAALGVVLVVAVLLVVAAPALATPPPVTTDIPMDGTPLVRNVPAAHQNFPTTIANSALAAGAPLHNGRPPDLVLTLTSDDPAHPETFDVPFWREYPGTHSDIYVGWDDLTPPPESSQQNHTITAEQIAYLGTEFDQRIWESDVFHFGNYKPRAPQPGMDGTKTAVFVYNIRDEAYYGDYPFYIVGYFSSRLSDTLHMNAMFIDSYDWANRLGPDVARPRLMEGTLAHEFQHLIHNDVDTFETEMIDEGMADLAEQFVYGGGVASRHIGYYLFYHRDSLLTWTGELYDYGNNVLWQDYLWEQVPGYSNRLPLGAPLANRVTAPFKSNMFAETDAKFVDPGDKFVWNLIHDQKTGLASVADWAGGMANVERLHRNYTLANLLDGKVSKPEWNYTNLALGGPDSDYYTIDQGIAAYSSNVNGNMPPTRKNVRRNTATQPWGAYYRTFGGSTPGFVMTFRGNATDGISPASAPFEWYSGQGAMLQRTLTRQIPNVPAAATLSFNTWFFIEQDWDYGYVEASKDGQTWTKLPQTTSLPVGVSDINASSAWDGPGGFTGNSSGWQQATFDLSGFTGNVWVRFRYATDESYNEQGWYVDDIAVGSVFTDPVDTMNGWITDPTSPWLFTNGLQNNDWSADCFTWFYKAQTKSWSQKTVVSTDGIGTQGSVSVPAQYQKSYKAYGIVSNRPDGTFDSLGRLTIKKGQQ